VSAARIDFQHTIPTGGIWHSLNRFLFTLIVLTMLVAIGYRMMPEISKRREQQVRVEELKTQVDKEKQILTRNTREENLLKPRSRIRRPDCS
jgi:Tfp pilus assembly protein PilO